MEVESAMKMMLSGADIGIIGGADGPTAVFVASYGFPWILPLVAVLITAIAFGLMYRAAKKKPHSVTVLPENYREIYTVDLQKNKKMALLVNGLGIAVILAMAQHPALTDYPDAVDVVAFLETI